MSVLQDMAEMPPHSVWAVVHVAPMPSRLVGETHSAHLVLQGLRLLAVSSMPLTPVLVSVEGMLR